MPGAPVPGGEELSDDELFTEAMLYESLLEDYSHFAPPAEGEVLNGYVLKVTDKDVIVDFGYKSEGVVPISQIAVVDGVPAVKMGDTIEVMVEKGGSLTPEGYVPLSHRRAQNIKAWETLEQAFRDNLLINGRVTGRIKGGLSIDVGVEAFMPGSQVDVRPVYNLDSFIGQDIPVRILKLNRRRANIVVSRKAALESEVGDRKSRLLETVEENATLQGIIKSLTEYGAFVDLGGIDGLLHVSDMSYGRVTHPSEVVQVGQEYSFKVLKFDREKERISLGLKQMAPDPWDTVVARYQVGARVIGRVVSITDYGSFVELEPGVEGLIHISEMTWSRRMKHPSKVVHVGDTVESVVLEIKPRDRRVSLGIKQLEADPWTTVAERYAVGSVVEGRVRKLSDFGAFIEIEEGIDGLVHVSDLSWTKHVKHPSELLKKGQIVQAVILNIDPNSRRLSLGVKQLQPDQWESFFSSHQTGDIVSGRVCRSATFGVFVEVAPGVEALCHSSEIVSLAKDKASLPLGEDHKFKIIRMNPGEKKIGLSQKAAIIDEERQRMTEYQKTAAAATSATKEAASIETTENTNDQG
ncbi:MAG: 30S ribosomal protein S1 [Acidobacteria bacterium]|nr:30S ribosomal protein S1 [Acidobacteriota bacterium]